MIRISVAAILFAFSTLCFSSPAAAQAMIEVIEPVHDFGTLEQGSVATARFEIRNTGNEPLIFSNVRSTSGNTVPTWSRSPLMPGAVGVVEVRYDARRLGRFVKSVIVLSSAANSPRTLLRIKGLVEAGPSEDRGPLGP